MEVAEEKDRLAPQVQELAWQNRNLERQIQDLRTDLNEASLVSLCLSVNLPYKRFTTGETNFNNLPNNPVPCLLSNWDLLKEL